MTNADELYWHQREQIRLQGDLDPLGEEVTPELRAAVTWVLAAFNEVRTFAFGVLSMLQEMFGNVPFMPGRGRGGIDLPGTLARWIHDCGEEELLTTLEAVARSEPSLLRTVLSGPVPGTYPQAINRVFRHQRFGFEMRPDGKIDRVGSPALHHEVVRPALARIRDPRFASAEDHFHAALDQFREGNARRCVHEAGSAVEAMLHALGYQGHRLADLADDFRRRSIERGYITAVAGELSNLMEKLYAFRSDRGAHAGKPDEEPVPDEYALLALHLAGSLIVFLADREQAG